MIKTWADRILGLLAVVSAPTLTLLVDTHVIAALTATDIGGIVAALVAGYHGGAAVQSRSATQAKAAGQ